MRARIRWALPLIFVASAAISAVAAHASLVGAVVSVVENIAVSDLATVLPPEVSQRFVQQRKADRCEEHAARRNNI